MVHHSEAPSSSSGSPLCFLFSSFLFLTAKWFLLSYNLFLQVKLTRIKLLQQGKQKLFIVMDDDL